MAREIFTTFVEKPGERIPLTVSFASPEEVLSLAKWKSKARTSIQEDAIEYAGLTCKRWGFYLDAKRAVLNVADLTRLSSLDSDESAFLTVARAPSLQPAPVGLCLFRRTWCNHLVIDFLAVHPDHLGGTSNVKGIGTALLFGVTEIASFLKCRTVWGEATKASAGVYERLFRMSKVRDLFIVKEKSLRAFRSRFLERDPNTRLLLTQNLVK